jgi:hypothetical protein
MTSVNPVHFLSSDFEFTRDTKKPANENENVTEDVDSDVRLRHNPWLRARRG